MSIKENQASAFRVGCAKLNPLRPHNMEAFLEALATLIDEHDDLTVIDVLGALQLTQQRIALDALLGDEDAE